MAARSTTRVDNHSNAGIGVFVTSEDHPNCVLLGIRKGSSGAGLYALPGGSQEFGESWEECAIRETKEETGLTLKDVRIVHVFEDDGKKEVSLQGELDVNYHKEPQTLEPEKCEGWAWRDWNDFPPLQELFYPLRVVIEENIYPFKLTTNKSEVS